MSRVQAQPPPARSRRRAPSRCPGAGAAVAPAAGRGAPARAWHRPAAAARDAPTRDDADGGGAGRPARRGLGLPQLPLAVGAATVGAQPLAFGPPLEAGQPRARSSPSCATPTSRGWQVFETPVDASATPTAARSRTRSRPGSPAPAAASSSAATPAARRPTRWSCSTTTPGGPWQALQAPPATVLLPVEGERPAEELAGERGAGASPVAAYDEAGGKTGLFFAPIGRSAADGIIHFDGTEWTPRAG